MRKDYIIGIFFILFTFTSCQIVGLTSGYSHLPQIAKERVVECQGSIADIKNFYNVYTVTVEQVKEYLSTHDRVVIYDYTPFCKSKNCIHPDALFSQCEKQGAKTLLISNIYEDIFNVIGRGYPVLMINTAMYDTKSRSKYIDLFYKPLIGVNMKEVNYSSYHYFYKGKYIRSFEHPSEIMITD